jgi:hypothetical protein
MHKVNRKKTRGSCENKTFENVWRSFSRTNSDDEKRKVLAEHPVKKKVVNGKGTHSFLRARFRKRILS